MRSPAIPFCKQPAAALIRRVRLEQEHAQLHQQQCSHRLQLELREQRAACKHLQQAARDAQQAAEAAQRAASEVQEVP